MGAIELAQDFGSRSARLDLDETFYARFAESAKEEKLLAVVVGAIGLAGAEEAAAERLASAVERGGLSDVEAKELKEFLARLMGGAREGPVDFSRKFQEYEHTIQVLTSELRDARAAADLSAARSARLGANCEALEERLAEIERRASEARDEAELGFFEREKNKEEHWKALQRNWESRRAELENSLAQEKDEVALLTQRLRDADTQLHEAENKLAKLEGTRVDRLIFERVDAERATLERKVAELENSAMTTESQRRATEESFLRVKERLEAEKRKSEADYEAKVQNLTQKLEAAERKARAKEVAAEGPAEAGPWAPAPLDIPSTPREIFRSSISFEPRSLNQFDHFHDKLEELRSKFDEENENLKRTVRDLKEELSLLKLNSNPQTSIRSLASLSMKDLSASKKSEKLSDEFVEKMVKLEHSNKLLKYDNRSLREKLQASEERRIQELATLYDAVVGYKQYLD